MCDLMHVTCSRCGGFMPRERGTHVCEMRPEHGVVVVEFFAMLAGSLPFGWVPHRGASERFGGWVDRGRGLYTRGTFWAARWATFMGGESAHEGEHYPTEVEAINQARRRKREHCWPNTWAAEYRARPRVER